MSRECSDRKRQIARKRVTNRICLVPTWPGINAHIGISSRLARFSLRLGAVMLSAAGLGVKATEPSDSNYLTIVGSSTLYPVITVASEGYGRKAEHISPTVESTGTGGGLKLFCNGSDPATPDINMASRAVEASKWKRCAADDGAGLRVYKLGRDGVVLGNSRKGPEFALGAMRFDPLRATQARDKQVFENQCHALREDGVYIAAGENDARLVGRLISDPEAVGILGFNQLLYYRDRLKAVPLEGIGPTSIADGSYPLSRPLFLFAKQETRHRERGILEFLEYLSRGKVSGAGG